jgi:putative hemolysin
MKTLMISLMALTLGLGSAKAEKSTTAASHKASHAVVAAEAYKTVLEENRRLKLQLEDLENQQAEMQSTIAYSQMMSNMMLKLEAQKLEDQQADMQAINNYNKMMAAALQAVKNK